MAKQFTILPLLAGMLFFQAGTDTTAAEADRIIGLLALPQLFGSGPCEHYESHPLSLFETADGTVPIGEVRVDAPWRFSDAGGCEGLSIGMHGKGAWSGEEFATMEFAYDTPGAIVLARRGRRYKIELDDSGGTAWVEPAAGADFHSLEELVSQHLTYLEMTIWNGRICDRPGESETCRTLMPWSEPQPLVSVFGHRRIGDEIWFEIGLPIQDGCDDPSPDTPRVRGWISAYEDEGEEPVIWFYSGGC